MVSPRIRIAKDKAEFVQSLLDNKDTTGAFQTYADIIAFSACVGLNNHRRTPFDHISREPAPINLEIFISRGYEPIINLIAVLTTKNPKILSNQEINYEEQRIKLFEEYANGGLEILKDELRGAVDYTERLLLIMMKERFKSNIPTEEFDLSKFL